MLSSDLKMLADQLQEKKNRHGELVLAPLAASLVENTLLECIDQARHLEAARVRRHPPVIDLSDPKIALFPKARRPLPMRAPEDGGAA